MISKGVILAAGRGTRLKEVTANRSKALAPIAGIPMIGRVMDALAQGGISECIVVRAPHDDELQRYCASRAGVTVVTQLSPLGSADALRACEALLEGRFVVSACDSLVPAAHIRELIRSADASGADVTLSVMEVPATTSLSSRSVVTLKDGAVLDIIEKPSAEERTSNVTALPLYVLSTDIFAAIAKLQPSPRGEYELPTTFRWMIQEGRRVRAVLCPERLDLTDSRDLLLLNERFLSVASPSIRIHPSASVLPSVTLVGPVLIEEGVSVGEGATLGPCVYLERGSKVERGCRLQRVVVLRGGIVRADVTDLVVIPPTSV